MKAVAMAGEFFEFVDAGLILSRDNIARAIAEGERR